MHALGRSLQDHALRPTPLQRVDARVKLLLLLAYTLAVVTTPITALYAFGLYTALLMIGVVAGRVPARLLAWRLMVILPFLLIAALCIPLYPTHGYGGHGGYGGHTNGGYWFANLALKSLLGAGATLLLTASTPFPRLIAGLEQLGAPSVIVMIFSFTYRYFFVLAEELTRMVRARDSRGYRGHWLGDTRVLGQMIGTLFLRSYERGERVYLAMLSRGFQGIARSEQLKSRPPAWPRRDLGLSCAVTLLLLTTWGTARLLPL